MLEHRRHRLAGVRRFDPRVLLGVGIEVIGDREEGRRALDRRRLPPAVECRGGGGHRPTGVLDARIGHRGQIELGARI